jgi:hypothetical protein
MARPITWQNVDAAPNVGAIEALLRSGRQAASGFEDIGKVFGKANQDIKEAATGAAVAAIANSNDPMAQQAATPNTWQFDPLAIATAANAREGQMFSRKVGESNLRENEAQVAKLEADAAARKQRELIATMVQPYEPLARAGKEFELDNNPFWKSEAGFEAVKYLNDLRDTAFSQEQQRAQTAAARTSARAAQLQLETTLNRQAAEDAFVAWTLTPDGIAAGPAQRQAAANQFARQYKAGDAFGEVLVKNHANTRGIVSEAQRATTSPEGIGYDSALSALAADTNRLTREKAVATRDLELASAGAKAMGVNKYSDMAPEAINQAVLNNNKDMAEGKGWFTLAKDSEDVQDARDDARAIAKDIMGSVAQEMNVPVPDGKYIPLLPEQEANIAELLLVGNDGAAQELVRQYVAYNLIGADKGLETVLLERTAQYDTAIAKNLRAAQETEGAAAGKRSVPARAREVYGLTKEGRGWQQASKKPWDFVDISLQKNLNQR